MHRSESRGAIVRMAGFTEWFGRVRSLYGNTTAIVGLPIVSFIVSAAIGYFEGLHAAELLMVALVTAAAALGILKWAENRILAYAIIGGLLSAAIVWAAWRHNQQMQDYRLIPASIELGLQPYDTEHTMVAAVVVGADFNNNNDFDIWYSADRHLTSLNGRVPEGDTSPVEGMVRRQSGVGIEDGNIQFDQPLPTYGLAKGTVDYHMCYGRSKGHFDKGLEFIANFTPIWDGKVMRTQITSHQIKESKCDTGDE